LLCHDRPPTIGTVRWTVPAVQADSRIAALDGLRGIASLAVVFYHFFPHIARDPTASAWMLQRLPRGGDEGVTLFFVLSGFLISGILVAARSSTHYFFTFYARRAYRIFPLYYAVLLGYVAMLAMLGPGSQSMGRLVEPVIPLWTFFLYLQNFAMSLLSTYGGTWMAGSWSLAVEEQFYLTLPAIVRFTTDRGLALVAIACVVLPIPLRAAIQHFKFIPELSNKLLLFTAVDALAIGILVMLAVRYGRDWLVARRSLVGWATLAAVGGWGVYPLVPNPQAIRLAFLNPTATSLMCGFVLLFLLIAPDNGFGRLLSRPTMRLLGNMAYSTYLFHPIILCFAFQSLQGGDPVLRTTRDLGPIAVALVGTAAASYASWRWFESRLLKIGHRWRY
jgi:peptidoglycan/LPS O-acetylase OafA/YrhL